MHAKFLSNKRAEVEHGKRRWTYRELDKKKVICIQKQIFKWTKNWNQISHKCIQNLLLHHLFRVKNSSSIRKVLPVTFFQDYSYYRGCALKTSVFSCWTSHFPHKQFKHCLSSTNFGMLLKIMLQSVKPHVRTSIWNEMEGNLYEHYSALMQCPSGSFPCSKDMLT